MTRPRSSISHLTHGCLREVGRASMVTATDSTDLEMLICVNLIIASQQRKFQKGNFKKGNFKKGKSPKGKSPKGKYPKGKYL